VKALCPGHTSFPEVNYFFHSTSFDELIVNDQLIRAGDQSPLR
jgi:hypothetical protein